MGALSVAIAIIAMSVVTFTALFGRLPALRNTPIGYLHRLLFIQAPKLLRYLDDKTTGGKSRVQITQLGYYLVNQNHPLVLVFFLSILTTAASLFLSSAWSRLYLSDRCLVATLLSSPYIFTYLCASSSASYITTDNHDLHMREYPYDHILYHPGIHCRTCLFTKPARSKHCPLCQTCVSRLDHHCAWVANCVGRRNYKWFLALLLSLGVLEMYGVMLAHRVLSPLVPRSNDVLWRGQKGFIGFFDRWGYGISQDVRVGSVGLLTLLTGPLAWALFFYHLYLIWAGTTTNETSKWEDLRNDMADGLVWKGSKTNILGSTRGGARGNPEDEPEVDWPVQSGQVVYRTNDGRSPNISKLQRSEYNSGEHWEQCWRLGQVDNLYDLGFQKNLADALSIQP